MAHIALLILLACWPTLLKRTFEPSQRKHQNMGGICLQGNNFFGQLGTGTTANSLAPVPVVGGMTFVALTASADGCVLCAALLLVACQCCSSSALIQSNVRDGVAQPIQHGAPLPRQVRLSLLPACAGRRLAHLRHPGSLA